MENTPAFMENAGVFFSNARNGCVFERFLKTVQNRGIFERFFSL